MSNNIINNISILKKKIKYIINKTQKYSMKGGNSLSEKFHDMPQINEDLGEIIDKLKIYLFELDKLVTIINETKNENNTITDFNKEEMTKKIEEIKKFLSIDNQNNIEFYIQDPEYDKNFIINLRKLYYGFYKDRKFNNIQDFNTSLIEEIKTKITGVTKLNDLIIQYTNNIKNKLKDFVDIKLFELKDIESQIEKAKVMTHNKFYSEKLLEPIDSELKIISIDPIKLDEILKSSKEIFNVDKNKLSFISNNKNLFLGGNTQIIGFISQFNNQLDKCEKLLSDLDIVYESFNKKKKNSENYIHFIVNNMNKKPAKKWRYINKKILKDNLEKINKIFQKIINDNNDEDNKYYVIIEILIYGLKKFINSLNDNDIIDINKLSGESELLFAIFNDFYSERLIK
jgi:hypothetical protein